MTEQEEQLDCEGEKEGTPCGQGLLDVCWELATCPPLPLHSLA